MIDERGHLSRFEYACWNNLYGLIESIGCYHQIHRLACTVEVAAALDTGTGSEYTSGTNKPKSSLKLDAPSRDMSDGSTFIFLFTSYG